MAGGIPRDNPETMYYEARHPYAPVEALECALMMHANGQLSHDPPQSWDCYSSDGASAAGSSNIAGTSGFAEVGLYM